MQDHYRLVGRANVTFLDECVSLAALQWGRRQAINFGDERIQIEPTHFLRQSPGPLPGIDHDDRMADGDQKQQRCDKGGVVPGDDADSGGVRNTHLLQRALDAICDLPLPAPRVPHIVVLQRPGIARAIQ